MTEFAFVVASNERYLPEITGLLNSLDYIGNKHDVYLLSYKLPDSFKDQLSELDYTVNVMELGDEMKDKYGEAEILMRYRYKVAADLTNQYSSVCVLDADMFFCRNVDQFFEISSRTGLIIGAALEQKRWYPREDNHKVNGEHLFEPTWNYSDFCCCPLFFTINDQDTFQNSWYMFAEGGFKGPDMDAINMAVIADGKMDRVLLLPNVQFVGSNEKLLKAYIRAVYQEGDKNIWTETGDPVYIVHGQYYKALWRRVQVDNQKRCCDWYLGSEKAKGMADGSMELLQRQYFKMLEHKIQIEKKAYSPNGEHDNPHLEIA